MAQFPDSPLAASPARLSYLDWLRFLVVLCLAPFHAALSYTGMGVVYVYDTPIRDLLLSGVYPHNTGPAAMRIFTIFMDNWFMHLLFMVSGIAAASSLRKRSAGQFVGERADGLLLPLLLGTLCVISIQSWLRAVSFGRFPEASSPSTRTSFGNKTLVRPAKGTSTTASSGSCCTSLSSRC